MYSRKNYEMTQADLDAILEACKVVPYMIIGGQAPRSQQENANEAWLRLGEKMGFDHMTVLPGSGNRFFSAVPTETGAACAKRLANRHALIALIEQEIAERQAILKGMRAEREG